MRFNIKLFDVTNDFIFDKQFGDYQSEAIGERKLPLIKYVNSFQADVPYKLEAWQRGRNLKDVDDCKKKLESAYNKISKIIQDGQFGEYKKLISKRENNMATSMYLTKDESEKRIEELIKDFNSGFKVQSISKEAVLFLYVNNKVAMLKKPNGEPALYLENIETEEELMLEISFYIQKEKKTLKLSKNRLVRNPKLENFIFFEIEKESMGANNYFVWKKEERNQRVSSHIKGCELS